MFFFTGVPSLAPKRLEIGGVSFRVISSPMNAAIRTRRRGSPDQNWLVRPKTVIFWPFFAFEGRLGGLKDPPEVPVEDETCRTIHGT